MIEQGQQKAILNEMIIMKLLVDVPAVVRLHDALEDSTSVYFVMELCKYVQNAALLYFSLPA